MPNIRSSADLRNRYNDIPGFCHTHSEPTFIIKSVKGNLATMSIETHEQLIDRFELYGLIQEGLVDIQNENTCPFFESISYLKNCRKR